MDPGLLVLGACAVGATALLRVLKKRQEGFDVPQTNNYPVTAAQGQQMYNPLSLAADPRVTVPAIATMPADQQTAYVGAVNAALTPTATDASVPGRITVVGEQVVFSESEHNKTNTQEGSQCGLPLSTSSLELPSCSLFSSPR